MQYGFRKGFGTIEAFTAAVTDIQNNFSHDNYMVKLFIDIQSAYDNACLSILEAKMTELLEYLKQLLKLSTTLF